MMTSYIPAENNMDPQNHWVPWENGLLWVNFQGSCSIAGEVDICFLIMQ